jgi:RNA 2',3'-cyclic 3'-phosphodiesterase
VIRPASVGGGERARIFLGFRVPDDVVERLVAWQRAELRGRVVPPENLHVTVAFLGSRPVTELADIGRELRAAADDAAPPVLAVCRYRETRSVGMLVLDDREGRAAAVADDVHGRLERLGVYRREARPWFPHLTVLRFRERPRLRPELPDLREICPSEAAVYHSVLRLGGAQYEVLESVVLGG